MKAFHSVTSTAVVLDRADVDTDQIIPKQFLKRIERSGYGEFLFFDWRKHTDFELNHQRGKILIAGRNFGIGSSRPVAALMRHLGVTALVAEEFNSLFLRNAINNGLPAVTVPAVRQHVAEGDTVTVDLDGSCLVDGEVRLDFAPLPAFVLDILDAGGLLPRLVADGYLPGEVAGTTA